MSKFSHRSSGTLNNNFVRAAHFAGLRRETISIVNDNEFLKFFKNLQIFLRSATPGEFAYIRKSERDGAG